MEFLHIAFLAGTSAFAIPLAIHLIFQARKKRLVFPSLRFLRQSVLKETRKLRWREILLLLLRCAACILIALAFARPFDPHAMAGGKDGKPLEDLAIVLDDSPGMNAVENAGTHWQQATKRVSEEIAKLPHGSRAALFLSSDPNRAEVELTGNFAAVTASVQQRVRPSTKRGDPAAALESAVTLLLSSPMPVRRVLIISDFQSNQTDRAKLSELAKKAASGKGLPIKIEADGPGPKDGPPKRMNNLSVQDVRIKSAVWIAGKPVPVGVRLSNHGSGEARDVAVKLFHEGKELASRTVSLGPRATTEIELGALFPRAGETGGYVEISSGDSFADDDRRYFAVDLRDSLKAIVIEDQTGGRDAFLDEGYFIRMALNPAARGNDAGAPAANATEDNAQGYIQATGLRSDAVTAAALKSADLIVLAGPNGLGEKEIAAIEGAVSSGAGLMIFAGRQDTVLSESLYKGLLWKDGKGLLPARPGSQYEGSRQDGKYHQVGDFKLAHSLFAVFTGENEATLRLPKFSRHYMPDPTDLNVSPKDADGKPVRPKGEVLASFTDGTPFVMERPYGEGNVLMFSFIPRPETTDLPKRKAFVPLMHQAARRLAGTREGSLRALLCGDTFDFSTLGAAADASVTLKPALLPAWAAGTGSATTGAGGAASPKTAALALTVKDRPEAEFPGLYTAEYQKGAVRETSVWGVGFDPLESDFSLESIASIKSALETTVTAQSEQTDSNGLRILSDEEKAQSPVWRWLLLTAVACLLLEVWLRDYL